MKKRVILILVLLLSVSGCSKPVGSKQINSAGNFSSQAQSLQVDFIDVGQADSILVTIGGYSMLIDAGNNNDGEDVVDFIKAKGITKLDILVGTHPHEDHIGGMDDVISAFDIGQIIMPKVSHTSKTYKDVLLAIQNKKMSITSAKAGQSYSLGDSDIKVISPINDDYKGLNEHSVVMHLTYKNNSFLFTGDMEKSNEEEVLNALENVKADVLKVSHHGSRTSSSDAFLQAVSPKYGVIQVGKDNDYKHPHSDVLSRLKNMMTVYRTDLHGTISITSDGNNLSFATEKEAA